MQRSRVVILKVIHSEIGLGLGLAYKRCHTKSMLVVELQAAASGTSVTTAHIASSLGEQVKTYLLHVGLLELC